MSGGLVNSEGGIRKEDMYNSLVRRQPTPTHSSHFIASPPLFFAELTHEYQVKFVGCDTAANKIDCLRKAPYEKIYTHMQTQRM